MEQLDRVLYQLKQIAGIFDAAPRHGLGQRKKAKTMIATRLVLGQLDTNCWLAEDGAGGPLVVIDPAGDADVSCSRRSRGRPVAAIVLTHGHFDHIAAAAALVEATGAPLLVHFEDAETIATCRSGSGGAPLRLRRRRRRPRTGCSWTATSSRPARSSCAVIHTPGHTPGSICLHAADDAVLFSGDTLFAGSIGRTDFPGGDSKADPAFAGAARDRCPPTTAVHPGHGPDTTIGREERVNPFWPRA